MTIYALSSGSGISGIAVIRISGPETREIITKMTSGSFPKAKQATLKKICKIETKEVIDEGIVIWFPGPESYTGEDMAEFHVHGSVAVIEAIHTSVSKIANCRLAEPGEFTKLAFQNGKINLLKAESISDLIGMQPLHRILLMKMLFFMVANSFIIVQTRAITGKLFHLI